MSTRKIGLDLDGVVFDFTGPFSRYVNKALGTNIHPNDITTYDWFGCANMTEEQFHEILERFDTEHGWRKLPFYPGAAEALRKEVAQGAELYVVTMRTVNGLPDALEAFAEAGIPIKDAVTGRHGSRKIPELQAFGVSCFAEDRQEYCVSVAQALNIPVYCVDRPHNKHWRAPEHLPIKKVRDLVHALEIHK